MNSPPSDAWRARSLESSRASPACSSSSRASVASLPLLGSAILTIGLSGHEKSHGPSTDGPWPDNVVRSIRLQNALHASVPTRRAVMVGVMAMLRETIAHATRLATGGRAVKPGHIACRHGSDRTERDHGTHSKAARAPQVARASAQATLPGRPRGRDAERDRHDRVGAGDARADEGEGARGCARIGARGGRRARRYG